jgi:hypothetical protein
MMQRVHRDGDDQYYADKGEPVGDGAYDQRGEKHAGEGSPAVVEGNFPENDDCQYFEFAAGAEG